MIPVKRIEIIANAMESPKIQGCLEKVRVPCYSVIRNVVGRSDRDIASDDFNFASSTLSNIYIIAFCQPERVDTVVEAVQPILTHFGGMCYVSDALGVPSVEAVQST